MAIKEIINEYYASIITEEHHRYKSWEHCYNYFRYHPIELGDEWKNTAQLHLAFYLASWGMYRGSSFLLQRDYKIHQYAVDIMMEEKYQMLWEEVTTDNLELMIDVRDRVIAAYVDNIHIVNGESMQVNVTDTLISKILLGVYGCVPAYDRYLKAGMKFFGITGSFSRRSMTELLSFQECFKEQFEEMQGITKSDGTRYTNMKLIDMFFWQVGYWLDEANEMTESNEARLVSIRKQFANYRNQTDILKPRITAPELRNKTKYKISVIDMVKEAADSIDGKFTTADVKHFIHTRYGDVHDATINAQMIVATVNAQSRVNWGVNQNERVADGRYDFLFKHGRGLYEKFNPMLHGEWSIYKDVDGYKIKKVER